MLIFHSEQFFFFFFTVVSKYFVQGFVLRQLLFVHHKNNVHVAALTDLIEDSKVFTLQNSGFVGEA